MTTLVPNVSPKLLPSFSIYRADGSKVPSLKKAFVRRMVVEAVSFFHGYLTLEDGTKWFLVREADVEAAIREFGYSGNFQAIISFQVHEHGNFAVARLFNQELCAAASAEEKE